MTIASSVIFVHHRDAASEIERRMTAEGHKVAMLNEQLVTKLYTAAKGERNVALEEMARLQGEAEKARHDLQPRHPKGVQEQAIGAARDLATIKSRRAASTYEPSPVIN
ncbi:hypothetical protein B0A55_04146 [Friedmanniomyces simplex]|uniref:Uncharacterized protein n=1 Tax=Friedmanniomyces simplex TaxID=329884 RepID=A0A4V5NHR7_9PEZI|nr:hypothetical protein B0A55_04146 [Friedmanniomyces simplex]